MVHLLICFRDASSEVKAQVEDITPLRKTPGDALLLRNLSCIVMVRQLKARMEGFERARSQ